MAECTFTPNMMKNSVRSGSRQRYDVQSQKTGYRPTSELNAKAYTTKFKFINLDQAQARSQRSESNPRKSKGDYDFLFASAGNVSDQQSSRN